VDCAHANSQNGDDSSDFSMVKIGIVRGKNRDCEKKVKFQGIVATVRLANSDRPVGKCLCKNNCTPDFLEAAPSGGSFQKTR
jgi:hypothetical protein